MKLERPIIYIDPLERFNPSYRFAKVCIVSRAKDPISVSKTLEND